jgi:hypothetical protein
MTICTEDIEEFAKVFERIPKQARGPTQDESRTCDPFDAQGMKEIESGKRHRS